MNSPSRFAENHIDSNAARIANTLLDAVRGESREAAFVAACEVVYLEWAKQDGVGAQVAAQWDPSREVSLRALGEEAMQRMVFTLGRFELSTREQFAAVFEALLELRSRQLARAGLGYASSPMTAKFMAALVGNGERLLDPACGLGGSLLAAARMPRATVSGVDINHEAAMLARRRLALGGIEAHIEVYDWLTDDPASRWDAVVIEPPMGLKLRRGEYHRAHRFVPTNDTITDGDVIWLAAAADALTANGRAVVLLPDGVAFRGGRAGSIRNELLASGCVEAIISMPAGSALGTSVQTTLWVLAGSPDAHKREQVLLVNGRAMSTGESHEDQAGRVLELANAWLERADFTAPGEDWFARPVPIRALMELGDATPQRHLSAPPEEALPRPDAPQRLVTELRLASFKSVGRGVEVPLRPLTLIYGKNSAGKSSLIQSLLLMKQSVEVGRLAPTGSSVNLGSVGGLTHNHDESVPIELGITFASSSELDAADRLPNPRLLRAVDFTFDASDARRSVPSEVSIQLGDERFSWATSPDHKAATANVAQLARMVEFAYRTDSVHPPRNPSTSDQPGAIKREFKRMGVDEALFTMSGLTPHAPAPELLAEARHRLASSARAGRVEGILRTVGSLFGAVGDELAALLGRIAYLGPLRQAPERISVRARDPHAFDLPFFLLDNISEREEVSNRLQQLGVPYDLDVVTISNPADRTLFGDMAALVLTDTRTGTRLSPADVGFGISQVLPIVAELSVRTRSVILIEQPEIHLHPAMQADLADLVIESVDAAGRANQVIAETHSENLILRVQRRIREGALSADDVAVLYVDQDASGEAYVRRLRLDADGDFLDAWPHGFFAERFDDVFGEL